MLNAARIVISNLTYHRWLIVPGRTDILFREGFLKWPGQNMNYLKAVFWDYPQFTDDRDLGLALARSRQSSLFFWFLTRFLEYGRVVDVFRYFRIEEIAENLSRLRLSPYAKKKWQRMIEVYDNSQGR